MICTLYRKVLKPILFKFNPDSVHSWFIRLGSFCGKYRGLKTIIKKLYGSPELKEPIIVDGVKYYGPVLLSAGFDYNGHLSSILFNIGFAGEEVGSVSARPCSGNPPPHLKRLIKSQGIQVYKGLKNDGVDKIIDRLKKKTIDKKFVLGISIARTNDLKSAEEEQGIQDYLYSFQRLNDENIGDFYTINISCPNINTGTDFTGPSSLNKLLKAIKSVPCAKPIYIKMPINKDWDSFFQILKIIDNNKINGVVIGNLNKNYQDLDYPSEVNPEYRGGISGKACAKLSNELIRRTRKAFPYMTILGCGGIMTVQDSIEKLEAGANLIQLISGMIFNGPHLINQINESFPKNKSK